MMPNNAGEFQSNRQGGETFFAGGEKGLAGIVPHRFNKVMAEFDPGPCERSLA